MERDLAAYEEAFQLVQYIRKRWPKGDKLTPSIVEKRKFLYTLFYCAVGQTGTYVTPYQSVASATLNKATLDHCFAPRVTFLAAMDQCPEKLAIREEVYKIIDFCRHTVKVTSFENGDMKYKFNPKGLPIIRIRTVDKYDRLGWVKTGVGLLQEKKGRKLVNSPFPLKHLIPDWFTAYEEKCMKEHGYL